MLISDVIGLCITLRQNRDIQDEKGLKTLLTVTNASRLATVYKNAKFIL